MTNGSCWIVTESDLGQLTLNNENTKKFSRELKCEPVSVSRECHACYPRISLAREDFSQYSHFLNNYITKSKQCLFFSQVDVAFYMCNQKTSLTSQTLF